MEVTGTFKQMKVKLVEESFDPGHIQDPLYILDDKEKSYIPLTAQVYSGILSGHIKLWGGSVHAAVVLLIMDLQWFSELTNMFYLY